MPRAPRLGAAGAVYHVIVGGLGRQMISCTDEDRESFLQRARRVAPRAYEPESGAGIEPAGMVM